MFKRTITALMILAAMLCLTAKVDAAARYSKDDTWLVYWYICGADNLEGEAHFSTLNIAELQEINMPPNVKVLLLAGGTHVWNHPTIKEQGDGIYLYGTNGLEKLVDLEADMGNPDTLAQFLKYGEENFPADRRILIFQDHGGQSGLCYDDKFAQEVKGDDGQTYQIYSFLTYDSLKDTFGAVYGESPADKPFELIGFNACMTGSYELANSIADFSRYMMGSEPSSNPIGYDIRDMFDTLANNPAVDGAQLGKVLCDGSIKRLDFIDKEYGYDLKVGNAFSVINLDKMPELRTAYENYFDEAVRRADKDNGFSAAFARAAESRNADRYSNTYTDLGLLAQNTKAIMPAASEKLLKAIQNSVVVNKRGDYLKGMGISTYYPYTSTDDTIISTDSYSFKNLFLEQNSNYSGQKELYKKMFSLDVSEIPNGSIPLEHDKDGNFVAKLTPEQLKNFSSVECILLPVTEGNDPNSADLGGAVFMSSDDLTVDWDKGIITEKFRAVEPVFEGNNIWMFPTVSGRGHTFYHVPILYNDTPIKLIVRYEIATKKYTIVGFGSMIENGMVRKKIGVPEIGDVITPLYLVSKPKDEVADPSEIASEYVDSNNGKAMAFVIVKGEPFVLTGNSTIAAEKIANGNYLYAFNFNAPNGSDVMSEFGFISIEDGKITRLTAKELDAMQETAAK